MKPMFRRTSTIDSTRPEGFAGPVHQLGLARDLVTTDDGDLLINTGTNFEADEIKARFGRVSNGPPRAITFTQGHPDHVGGWSTFNETGVQTIAQANHGDVREYWRRLHPFYVRRIMALWEVHPPSAPARGYRTPSTGSSL